MLARDWYYTQRRQVGLDTAVASIYDVSEDSDVRARPRFFIEKVLRSQPASPVSVATIDGLTSTSSDRVHP